MICLFLLLSVCGYGQARDTFDVYFPLNDARLAQPAKEHIDMLVFKDSLIHGQQFIILGYADYLGSEKYNERLSAKRAGNVKAYLQTMGFTGSDIAICVGKGKIGRAPAGKDGIAADRKVQIVITNPPPAAPKPLPAPLPAKAKVAAPVAPKKAITVLDTAHLSVNQTVTLKNILFEGGMATILRSSKPELENLYNFLNRSASVAIRIEGHVCCKGISDGPADDSEIVRLSFARAKAIKDYLVARGINAGRITFTGFGSTMPAVYPARTEAEQEKNRRVEIRILHK